MNRGDYHESVRFGKMSVRYGESSSSSGLLISYTNLIDPYMLLGEREAAFESLEKARKWLGPEKRWRLRLTFLLEAASLALMSHNVGLAVDLIGQMEAVARGREDGVLMPGAYWKMRTFRMAHLGHTDEAWATISTLGSTWRNRAVFHYLDLIAAKAWLEMHSSGELSADTRAELVTFETLGLRGRKELLTLQGFLPLTINSASGDAATERPEATSPKPTTSLPGPGCPGSYAAE
jgi:hypothetical protein